MPSSLEPGDVAPPFELPDQHGRTVRLADYRGRKVLVYFYPAAFSVDCTAQSCSIRDHRAGLTALGIDVVGASPDSVDKQREFDDRYQLGFPLLADVDHRVAEQYGVWTHYPYDGQIVLGVERSSFLVDEEGRISHVWSPVLAEETGPKALAALSQGS
jgi:peroxiredoxin Q/BCP